MNCEECPFEVDPDGEVEFLLAYFVDRIALSPYTRVDEEDIKTTIEEFIREFSESLQPLNGTDISKKSMNNIPRMF